MEELKLPHDHGEMENLENIKNVLDRTDQFQIIADTFKMMSDPTRIRIFWLLCHMEECVANIAAFMGMSSPAISHHLRALKGSRLITSRREGKEVYYRAAASRESELLHQMIELVMEIACPEQKILPASLDHTHGSHWDISEK